MRCRYAGLYVGNDQWERRWSGGKGERRGEGLVECVYLFIYLAGVCVDWSFCFRFRSLFYSGSLDSLDLSYIYIYTVVY